MEPKEANKRNKIPINVWSIDNINDLDLWIASQEGIKKQVNIAQIKEIRAIIALALFDCGNVTRILLNNGEKLHKGK